MVHKVCLAFSVLCCAVFMGPLFTSMGLDPKYAKSDNSTESHAIHCPTPSSKLIIDLAEFSPASRRFCNVINCRSLSAVNSTECRYGSRDGTAEGGIVCNRELGARDVRRVYAWCQDQVAAGRPCSLRGINGLSQRGQVWVRYFCLEDGTDAPIVDPCDHLSHGNTNDLYHDLSISQYPRRCTCTGSVRFREGFDGDTVHLHISYLIMVNSSSPSTAFGERLRATVANGTNENKLNSSLTPDFLLAEVTRSSPWFTFTLQIQEPDPVWGFVWMHIRDRTVNVNCTSLREIAELGKSTDVPSVVSVSPSTAETDRGWQTLSAIVAAAGSLAVLISLIVLLLVLRRRRRRATSQITQPPSEDDPAPTQPLNSPPAETNFPSNHHSPCPHPHYSNQNATHSSSSSRAPDPPTGTDVNVYALLQQQRGHHPAAPPSGSGSVTDTYDHVMRCGAEDYQTLEREARRQEVIDNEYDTTTTRGLS